MTRRSACSATADIACLHRRSASGAKLPTIKGYYRSGAVGEQNNVKLVAKLGLHARHRCRTRLRKLKGTEHLAKVIADVQFYNGERGESLPETMISIT